MYRNKQELITTELSFSFIFIYIFLLVFVLRSCLSTDDIFFMRCKIDKQLSLEVVSLLLTDLWRPLAWHVLPFFSSVLKQRYQSALLTPKMAGKRILLLFEEIIFNPATYCLYWKIPQLPIIQLFSVFYPYYFLLHTL